MPKIVITATYAFEPDMDSYPYYLCETVEEVQERLQRGNNALGVIVLAGFKNGGEAVDCKVEIDRSEEG